MTANPPTNYAPTITYKPRRELWPAVLNGLKLKCPNCGQGALYSSYLKVAPKCASCGEELHHQRADDAPPYVVMVIVGHLLVAGLLALEMNVHPPTWVHLVIWLPLAVILSLALLPPVKGALIGIQWAHRMHGFGGAAPEPEVP